MNLLDSLLFDTMEETPGFLSYPDRIDEVLKTIDGLTWCNGDDGCEVLECAETVFEAIKEYNLSVHAGRNTPRKQER